MCPREGTLCGSRNMGNSRSRVFFSDACRSSSGVRAGVEQLLEAKLSEWDITELKHENVQALVEKGMLVLCEVEFAQVVWGKFLMKKNGTTVLVASGPRACRMNAQRDTRVGLAEMWCWTLDTNGHPRLMLTAVGQDVHGTKKMARGWLGSPTVGQISTEGLEVGCVRSHGKGMLGRLLVVVGREGVTPPFSLRVNPW